MKKQNQEEILAWVKSAIKELGKLDNDRSARILRDGGKALVKEVEKDIQFEFDEIVQKQDYKIIEMMKQENKLMKQFRTEEISKDKFIFEMEKIREGLVKDQERINELAELIFKE